MLVHVVLMKFSDPADAPEAKRRLEKLADEVEQIRTLGADLDELRTDVSWDLCLRTTHHDAEDLRGYQSHPAHREFGGWLRPLLTARAVVDYTV